MTREAVMHTTAERVTNALAEIGYPGCYVKRAVHPVDGVEQWAVGGPRPAPPQEVLWQAWIVAGSTTTPCRACYLWARPNRTSPSRATHCDESGLGTLDCGADRSEW